jgi:hypothetical protein
MKIVKSVEEIVNKRLLPPGSRIYASGNAATPQVMFRQLAADELIRGVELIGVLFLGDVAGLFTESAVAGSPTASFLTATTPENPSTRDGPSISSCTWATFPCRCANTSNPAWPC